MTTTVKEPRTAQTAGMRPRLDSVDLIRGAVMVIMVLDHTRDFFSEARIDPTDLRFTSVGLFCTRWITHFCAPVFVFLAGTGAFLSAARGKPKPELAWFLCTRGLWLIFLELTVVRLGMTFNPKFPIFLATILWAIGWSMIVLAPLVLLRTRFVCAFGIATIALHNLFDGVRPEALGPLHWVWLLLHQQGLFQLPGGVGFFVAYPIIPWVGVIAAGYAFGSVFLLEPARRHRVLLGLGLCLTLAFVAIRATNFYGDPRPWSPQKSNLFTLLSFLNCTKYPPSLLFLLMTLGPAIVALAFFDRVPGALARPVVIFGRVPLFFYILQWPLIHLLVIAVALVLGRPVGWVFQGLTFGAPPGSGFGLPMVYLMWLVVIALLYPPCVWFAGVKQRRRDAWLSYL